MSEPEADRPQTITTYELLERSARAALEMQREDGSFPPGRNGVYDEPETPVRTTSKWLMTLSKAYEITKDQTFKTAANNAADYLLSDEARPYGYTFHSRSAEGKDNCDGLVGQSPVIASLARTSSILDRPELIETAESVFSLHPFEEQVGLWERVETTGDRLSFDRTLNHQIFFAAAGSFLADEYPEAERQVRCFVDNLETNLRTDEDGLIRHFVRPAPGLVCKVAGRSPRRWNLLWNEFMFHYYARSSSHQSKEIGYHSVCLSGLATLKQNFPDHRLWESDKITRAVDRISVDQQNSDYDTNYGAMVPGLRLARVADAFDYPVEVVLKHIEKAVSEYYDFETDTLTNNAIDPTYQSSMINSLTYLPDGRLNFK
ncbi:hypothetical protein ACLI4Y_09485 [Natrialbaceae archaeon A-CW3]